MTRKYPGDDEIPGIVVEEVAPGDIGAATAAALTTEAATRAADDITNASAISAHAGASAPHSGHATTSHAHTQSDVTNLATDLAGKSPTSHTHPISDLTNLVVAPIGIILAFGGTTPDANWLICDGSAVSRTTYSALLGVIGTAFGAGNGTTTFNIPDARGRFLLGKAVAGTGSTLGGTGGAINHTHTADPPSTTTSTPSATLTNVALLGLLSTAPASGTHTHTLDVPSFNTGTANPPFIVVNHVIRAL